MHGREAVEVDGEGVGTDLSFSKEQERRRERQISVVAAAEQRRVGFGESQQAVSAAISRRGASGRGADSHDVEALVEGSAVAFASELRVLEGSFLPFRLHLYRLEMRMRRMGGSPLRRVFWSFGRAVKPSRCTPHSPLKEDMEKGFVLFNASHHSRRPKGPRAAFRLLGGFEDAAGAKKHATLLPDDCDLLLADIGRAFALTRTLPQNEGEHLQRLLATHNRRLRDHEQEFLGNVAEHKTGSVSEKDRATAEGSVDGVSEEAPSKISRNAELRCQNYAVLSIIHDSDQPDGDRQEPAAVVWGVYDTEDGAKDAIKKRHSLAVKDLHLEVCAMYEWLHPTEVAKHLDDIDEEFRDETLTNIISKRKQERRSVKAFRDLCGENEAPMVDLSQPESKRVGFANATKIAELSEGSTLLPDVIATSTQHSISDSI